MALAPAATLQPAADSAVALVRQNPLLVGGAVVALLVVLFVGWRVVAYLRRTDGERLQAILAKQDAVTVLMHPNPDPDAMASALAVDALATDADTETTLCYPGQIRHQENRAFQTVLDLDFRSIDAAAELDDRPVVLVDHNEARGFEGADSVDPLVVVDHHPGDGTGQKFTDVRTDTGACATIFAEYFREMGWDPVAPEEQDDLPDDDDLLPPSVATGMLYGIQSDTNQLTKGCSPAEFRAAEYLYAGIDEDSLSRIANPEVDAEVLDIKARAIGNRDVRNPFVVSDVGTVSNVDAIPQAADELTRLEGVTAVVVFGERDGTLHLSGRSRDDRVHMGKTLEAAVEDIPMSGAGGHARMGGGQISVEHMNGIGPSDGLDREDFTERLFDAMGGDI